MTIARHCLSRFSGPSIIHMGTGRCLLMFEELISVGTAVLSANILILEDLATVKAACKGKGAVLLDIAKAVRRLGRKR